MVSPARAHVLRTTAALASQTGAATARHHANGYELMLAKLDEDRRRLKQIQSVQRKIEVKREILPDYIPWVEGVLTGGAGVQDDVLTTIMLWRIDVGDFDGALQIASYAIKHDLVMPDRFERSVACLIAEEIADTALAADQATQAEYGHELYACEQLTADQDMPDQVRAKLLKACAYAMIAKQGQADDVQGNSTALDYLKRALKLHEKVGVRKDIEIIERKLRNSAKPQTEQG